MSLKQTKNGPSVSHPWETPGRWLPQGISAEQASFMQPCSSKGIGKACKTGVWPRAHSSIYFHHQSYTLPVSWHWKYTLGASHLFIEQTHMHLDFHLQLAIQSTELNRTTCFDSKPAQGRLPCEHGHTQCRQWDHSRRKKKGGVRKNFTTV